MARSIIIDGSHRAGNTSLINSYIESKWKIPSLKLQNYVIDYYDYSKQYNSDDQFIEVIEEIILNYNHIIWTTPMYWYAMSGRMKVFLDRFTDLLKTHKPLGRKLRGKSMSLIYNSNGLAAPYFEKPFENTAEYLGMDFLGALHINMGNDVIKEKDKILLNDFLTNSNLSK